MRFEDEKGLARVVLAIASVEKCRRWSSLITAVAVQCRISRVVLLSKSSRRRNEKAENEKAKKELIHDG